MYCKECGKEIEENAKFCSNCGYNFETENTANKVILSKKNDKLKAAFALNIIALGVVIAILGAYYGLEDLMEWDHSTLSSELFTGDFMETAPAWAMIIAIATTIMGFITKIVLSNNKSQKGFVYVYLMFAVITTMLTIVGSIVIFPLMLCLIGLIYYIPAILLIIAGVKFFQATK